MSVKNERVNIGPTLIRINPNLPGLADTPILCLLANSLSSFLILLCLIHHPPITLAFSLSHGCAKTILTTQRPLSFPAMLSPWVHINYPSLHLGLSSKFTSLERTTWNTKTKAATLLLNVLSRFLFYFLHSSYQLLKYQILQVFLIHVLPQY